MRDLMNILDLLVESKGMANRKPGDVFKNPEGKQLTFNNIEFYPEGGGKFSPEDMEEAVSQFLDITWENNLTAGMGGFGIASFTDEDGNEVLFGRFLQKINPLKTANAFPNKVGDYSLASKSAVKSQSGLTPQDLLTNRIDLSIADVMNQLAVSKLGTDSPLYYVAHRVALGEELPLSFNAPEEEEVSFTAFRDYFCEILQPIAILNGLTTGNAQEAIDLFFDGSVEGATISFDSSKTAGLSDSVLELPDGRQIKVSSKGGKGATASVSNILDSIEELKLTERGNRLLKKHREVIELIEEIKNQGQANSPLFLGVKFKVISEEEAEIVRSLKGQSPINLENLDKLRLLTPRLRKLAKERTLKNNTDNVSLFHHLLAAIAHKAVREVNENTNFSKAAAEILNNSALVQVYTKATKSKAEWTLQKFDAVYPSNNIKGVYLTADKTHYSTGINGNLTFKIDKGSDKPANVPNSDPEISEPSEPLADIATRIVDPMLGKREKSKSVGREKRK
jgi:hypothetical protein